MSLLIRSMYIVSPTQRADRTQLTELNFFFVLTMYFLNALNKKYDNNKKLKLDI